MSVEVLSPETTMEKVSLEHKSFYSITKCVLSVASQVGETTEQSDISYGTQSLTMLKTNLTSSDFETSLSSEKTGNILLFIDNMFIEAFV